MSTHHRSISTLIFTYYPLCLTGVTTVLNALTIFIFLQKVFRQRPAIRYMRAIALVDIFILYGWNLDHFFYLKYGFEVDRLSVVSCKISTYLNHLLSQSSAWLRVWMCIDRFVTLNQVRQRQAVYEHRRAMYLIIFTFLSLALINLHLPIFACYAYVFNNSTRISSNSLSYALYPTWNYVNLTLYNIIPFILMLIFTILIIRHLIIIKRTSSLRQSHVRHLSISIPILLSAFLFCIMTTPPALAFAFFRDHIYSAIPDGSLVSILDSIKYTYHSLSFLVYFLTLIDFRREFFRFLRCQCLNSLSCRNISRKQKANRYRTQSTALATVTK